MQQLAALAAGVDAQVDGIAGAAAAAPVLAQGTIQAAAGAQLVAGGANALVNGDAAQGWPGTVALADQTAGAPASSRGCSI